MADDPRPSSPCDVYVPCAGAISDVSSLLISMPCQLAAGHDGPHQLELTTADFAVTVTAIEVPRGASV